MITSDTQTVICNVTNNERRRNNYNPRNPSHIIRPSRGRSKIFVTKYPELLKAVSVCHVISCRYIINIMKIGLTVGRVKPDLNI